MDRKKMMDDMYGPLYAPIPDSAKYLERIGMGPVVKADRETLDQIIIAHQRSVPFENLDIFDDDANHISLHIPALYDKIVVRRRGGYCFECNTAFMALLQSLGYECYAIAVRIVMNNADRALPITHKATIVTIDGVRLFCDVGFGGPSPQGSVLIDESFEQPSGSNTFVFERDGDTVTIYRLVDGSKDRLMVFVDEPVDPVDFLAPNEYQSRSKYSFFRMSRICNRVTETGNVTLGGNVLKVNSDSGTDETILETEAQLRDALKVHYGIDVDFPLKMS